jgi:hypothetical protein
MRGRKTHFTHKESSDRALETLLNAGGDENPEQFLEADMPEDLESLLAPETSKKKSPAEALDLKSSNLHLRTRTKRRYFLDLSKINHAAAQIRSLPRNDETLHCVMGGDFNGWDLVPAIHKLARRSIEELYVTTLGFNQNNNSQLCSLIDDGTISRVTVICSDYFRDSSRDLFLSSRHELERRGQRLISSRNHSKILLLLAGAHYVVESSANLRSCNNLEQFCLTNSRPLYEFHRTWIEHVASIEAAKPFDFAQKMNGEKEEIPRRENSRKGLLQPR